MFRVMLAGVFAIGVCGVAQDDLIDELVADLKAARGTASGSQ